MSARRLHDARRSARSSRGARATPARAAADPHPARNDPSGAHQGKKGSAFLSARSSKPMAKWRGAQDFPTVATGAVFNPTSSYSESDVSRDADPAERVGILLLNLGGPEKLDDVQPFLYNLFADPDIIRLPGALQFLQAPLAALLSNSRAPKSREAYESIGGGSPLRRITDEQAARSRLPPRKGPGGEGVRGMRYWKPFTEDAVEQIKADGITKLVVLPLYPQFSISTSGSSLRLLEQIFGDDEYLQRGEIDAHRDPVVVSATRVRAIDGGAHRGGDSKAG